MVLYRLVALYLSIVLSGLAIVSEVHGQDGKRGAHALNTKNAVIVMGMIHGNHRKPGPYDLEHLKELIRRIQSDYVLTEIPPDRLAAAAQQFQETGSITEPRVRVFPEYTDALFPLTREMSFEIVPCAAWTEAMNDSRRATLKELRGTHADQYA